MLAGASGALHRLVPHRCSSAPRMALQVIDLFPDPPSVGGNVVVPPSANFPATLSAPSYSAPATITPFADWSSIIFAPTETSDLIAAVFIGIGLLLGPDFLLAPAGLVSSQGIRPGYALERVVGELLDADAQWLKDRKERLAADAPLIVRAPILLFFIGAGLLVNRLLLVALEDATFVTSLGIISVIGGGLLEVLREPLPTREERDRELQLADEFVVFAGSRLARGGRCHERDIVAAFRSYYPRYRKRDMVRA